jgi:transcription antitermination factor NusG
MNWLACRVMNGQEYIVRGKLKEIAPGAQVLVPRKYTRELHGGKLKTKSAVMLPGYMLIGTEAPLDVFKMKKLVKVVGNVTEAEIAQIKASEGIKDDVCGVGVKILVIEGTFQGCKGVVETLLPNGDIACKVFFQGIELDCKLKPEYVSSIDTDGKET